MSADYLIASLQSLVLGEKSPISIEEFIASCKAQLSVRDADAIEALTSGVDSHHPIVIKWRDLEAQIKNAVAVERARLLGVDVNKWKRPTDGCSVYWRNRAAAAVQEKDTGKRDLALDNIFFEAADELVTVGCHLSVEAAFAYAVKLMILQKREKISHDNGLVIFEGMTDSSNLKRMEK